MSTRTVTVYHLHYALRLERGWIPHVVAFTDPGEVDHQRRLREERPDIYGCVSVSGPHTQKVPA